MTDLGELQFESARAQIYRWAYRLLQNEHDALDATQTVLLKALRSPGESGPKKTAWLKKVTINHCIDQIRKQRPVTLSGQEPAARTGDTTDMDQSVRRARIATALQHLTDVQRVILLAKVHDQETFEAIAESLNVSASTVKTHYLRALEKMRDRLGTSEGDCT